MNDIPVPGWEEVAPFSPTSGAEVEPPASKFASSSVCMGSVLDALAGDAPRGGVVDGGGASGVALSGSSSCRPPPVISARSAPVTHTSQHPRRRGASGELTLGATPGAAIRAAHHHQWRPRGARRGLAARRGPSSLQPMVQRLHFLAKMKTIQDKRHSLRRRR